MAAPTVVSSIPSTGEAGVYKNKVVSVTFSEALLASTVNGTNFSLRNLDAAERVPVDVSNSLDGKVVSITPTRHLLANTAYKLTIVGADTAIITPIKSSSTSDSLAVTVYIIFTTGEEIEATQIEKTEAQKAAEGQIDLPSNLQVIAATSYLTLDSSTPFNKQFGVTELLTEAVFVFSEDLATSGFGSHISVSMEPYYEEDEGMMAIPTTSDGKCNFQWQEPTSETRGFDFTDVPGVWSVSGVNLTWTVNSLRDFPSNSKVKFTFLPTLAAAGGATMDPQYSSQKIEFYVKTTPDVLSVERVRDEFYPYVLTTWTDDMIGKTIYKNLLDIIQCIRWSIRCDVNNDFIRQYALYATVVDIYDGIRMEQELLAGQFKKLGDLVIRFDVRIPEAIPRKQREAIEKTRKLKDMLTARFRDVPMSVVRGSRNASQKQFMRTRLWRQDLLYALEGRDYGSLTAGNTRDERATKVPGRLDGW